MKKPKDKLGKIFAMGQMEVWSSICEELLISTNDCCESKEAQMRTGNEIQTAYNCMKRCSTSLITREMQIKTTKTGNLRKLHDLKY